MTHTRHTQQAILSSSVDEQSAVQAELNHLLTTQAQAIAPNQDPLTNSDRRIIGEIIQVEPESVRTIWIEAGITVWVQFLDGGRLPFDRDWFTTRVAQVKATLTQTPQAMKADKVPPAEEKKLTTVVCSFYDYEFYAASKLLASITYDDNLSAPWVVVVNGLEKFRANTWKRCHRFIQWHLNNSQLPSRNSQLNSISKSKKPCTCNDSITNSLRNCVSVAGRSPLRTTNCELLNEAPCPTENRIMAHIFNECQNYDFALLDDGIYHNDVKLGEVGCTDGNWWVIQGSSGQQQYCNSVMDSVRTLSMVDTLPHAQVADYEELLDRPFEMLTNSEWELLRESASA